MRTAGGHSGQQRRRGRAFTLMEVAITSVIIGIGFVATMHLVAVSTQQNMAADHATVGMHLAQHLEEYMSLLPFDDPTSGSTGNFGPEEPTPAQYDDVDDFASISFCPPVDARLQPLNDLGQYTQVVRVVRVDPNRLGLEVNGYTGAARVDVTVEFRASPGDAGIPVFTTSWIRADE